MSIRTTVLGTVIGGVILTPIVWWLESIKRDLPIWLGAAVELLWTPIGVPRAVAWITALAIGFLVFDFWFTSRAKKKQEAMKAANLAATPATLILRAREPRVVTSQDVNAMKLEDDEEAVLASLTQFGESAEAKNLLQKTKLSDFRFEHAIGSLTKKFLISDLSTYHGRGISFKQAGREYAARHDLDKR